MTCWKWFNSLAKEAGVEINEANKDKIDALIHKYIGEKSSYGHCSADWKKAKKEIAANQTLKQELIAQLKKI